MLIELDSIIEKVQMLDGVNEELLKGLVELLETCEEHNRPMTLEEFQSVEIGFLEKRVSPPLYYAVQYYGSINGYAHILGFMSSMDLNEDTYGSEWRIWKRRPSELEAKITHWSDEK